MIYSDAEGDGNIAVVFVVDGHFRFFMTRIPNHVRKRLRKRRTNIVAFELVAAILSMLVFSEYVESDVHCHRYIDSTPAMRCIVRGFSRHSDLLSYTGMLWYEGAER